MKLKKKIIALTAAGMLAVSSSAFAGNVGPGLGYLLVHEKEGKGWDLLGAFLNGLWYNQLFAISSGTWGYDKAEIAMAETNQFITDNMDAIAADIANGEGEYIDTLSSMLNVSDSVAFKAALKNNFDEIFSSSEVSAQEVANKIYSLVG